MGEFLIVAWDGSSATCSLDAVKATARALWQDAIESRAFGKPVLKFYYDGTLVEMVMDYRALEG